MRRRLEFSPSFDSALEVMASGIGKSEPRLVWIVIALATLTAAFDRFAVSHVIDAVYDQGSVWRVDLLWVLGAIVAAFLSGRWARVMALTLAQRAGDTALVASTKRLLAADWSDLGAEAPRKALTRIAGSMQEDASQAAAALPSIAALPLTAAWLSLLEPTSLLIVIVLIIVGTAILRREGARVSASETVLDHTETAFDRLTERLLAAGPFLRLTAEPQAEFCTRALWPAVDDATRAASVQARAHARAAGILGWLVFVLLLVFLTFAAGSGQDSHWMRALIVVAATLHHARQAAAAYLAFERVGVGAQQLAAVAEQFPVAQTVAPTAPARWSSIALRRVRFDQRDTPSVFLAAVGPLDLELHRGEIIALTGSNSDDRGTLLHLLCGLVSPDSGTVLLDGRPIPPTMLRGLAGGALDREALPLPPRPSADPIRTNLLLARFDLSSAIMHPAGDEDTATVSGDAERIRLAIVYAEMEDRPIRLYDERATHLEPRFRDAFAETLQEARARGRTCIVATDDAQMIAIADRVLSMRDGNLLASTEEPA